MRMIHVLRKPLSEGTVAANTLKHGTGGLNIDASRVGASDVLVRPQIPRTDNTVLGKGLGSGTQTEPSGRWPANVILSHLDGCKQDGIKRVKGSFLNHECTDGDLYGKYASVRKRGHTDKDGKETVANWICAEGCPVVRLDEQTKLSQSSRPNRVSGQFTQPGQKGLIYGNGFGGVLSPTYDDKGGASRFYKQVGGEKDA